MAVEPEPKILTAAQWFDIADADGSGAIDEYELCWLYE
jgi:hypothetical protein